MSNRKPAVYGNWKMNTRLAAATELAQALSDRAPADLVDVGVAPPFVYLGAVSEALGNSGIILCGQDGHWESDGAFTGAISSEMLRDVGCSHVILGHSERRHVFGESNETVGNKARRAWNDGLTVILCVGETLEERENGQTMDVVLGQLRSGLAEAAHASNTLIAYEPVWAIGTGKTATPEQAQAVHESIRAELNNLLNAEEASAVQILYGGSVKPANAAELLSCPDIDGALVGGASLKPDDFLAIIDAGIAAAGS